MKELLELLDKKTAVTVSVVCLSFLFLITVIGGIGRDSYSPYIIGTFFGVNAAIAAKTKDVAGDIENVILDRLSTRDNPAGYSRTFTYDDEAGASTVRQTLIFFARDDQFVKIDVVSNSFLSDRSAVANADRGQYQVGLDGIPWAHTQRQVGDSVEIRVNGNDMPKVTQSVGTGSHTLVIAPLRHRYKEITSFDCLVLVSNRPF